MSRLITFIVGKRTKADKLQFANITGCIRDKKAFPKSSRNFYEYAFYIVILAETNANFPQSVFKKN